MDSKVAAEGTMTRGTQIISELTAPPSTYRKLASVPKAVPVGWVRPIRRAVAPVHSAKSPPNLGQSESPRAVKPNRRGSFRGGKAPNGVSF